MHNDFMSYLALFSWHFVVMQLILHCLVDGLLKTQCYDWNFAPPSETELYSNSSEALNAKLWQRNSLHGSDDLAVCEIRQIVSAQMKITGKTAWKNSFGLKRIARTIKLNEKRFWAFI